MPDKGEVRCSSHRWPTTFKKDKIQQSQGFQRNLETDFLCEQSPVIQQTVDENSNLKRQTRTKVEPKGTSFLSIGEVAKLLNKPTKTIRQWCITGKLPAIPKQFGSKTTYQISRKAVEILISDPKSEQYNHDYTNRDYTNTNASAPHHQEQPDHSKYVANWQQAMRQGLMTGKPFSKHTIDLYSHYINEFFDVYNRLSIDAVETSLLSTPAEQFGRKDKMYKALISFAKYLIQRNALSEKFLEESIRLKPKRHLPPKRISLSEKQIQTLISVCETPMERALVILLSSTGLRASECCDLTLEDIDIENRALTVRLGKGNKTRKLGLNEKTIAALREYINVRPAVSHQYVFVDKIGGQLRRDGLLKRIQRLGEAAGVKANCHALRRSFVTIHANQGKPLQMLQIACGHSDIKTTRSYCLTTENDVIMAMQNWE